MEMNENCGAKYHYLKNGSLQSGSEKTILSSFAL